MAIDKKLLHFNKDEDFQKEKDAGNILDKSIIFTGDDKKIYTHGEEYKTVTWSKLKSSKVPVEIVVNEGVEQIKINIYEN